MPNKFFTYTIIFLSSLSYSCTEKDTGHTAFDYKDIEISDVQIITDTSENELYISGQLRDLIRMPDGTMLVSDLGSITIEQFSAAGEHLKTIAKRGRGPGELSTFFILYKGAGDTLLVRHRGMFNQMDYYYQDYTDGIYRYHRAVMFESPEERYVQMFGDVSEIELLATARHNIPFYHHLTEEAENFDFVPVVLANSGEKIIQDSLHLLKTPNPETDFFEGGMNVLGMPPYQYQDRLRVLSNDRYMIARPDSAVLYIYNHHHTLDREIPLHTKLQKIEKSELDIALGNMNRSVRKRMEERVPEYKPPFLDVWASDSHILLHTDNQEEGKEMVVLSMSGEPEARFYLSEYDGIQYFTGQKIYSLHRNPDKGHSVRVYQINY